jgi:hypothetical protein
MTQEEPVDDGEEGWVSGDDSVSFNSDVEDWVDLSGGSLGMRTLKIVRFKLSCFGLVQQEITFLPHGF